MVYNISLFMRLAYRSIFKSRGTNGELKGKRLGFMLLFYLVWPIYTLWTWAFLLLDDLLFPGYKMKAVEKPLFILGNFRSGSTYLYRLFSHDASTFTSLRTADIFFAPSVTQKKLLHVVASVDSEIGHPLKNFLLHLDKRTLGQVHIHHVGLFEPEEDENILLHIWSSFFIGFMFPFWKDLPRYEFFDEAIPAPERRSIMRFYKSCIQRHLYATGAKRIYLSKNPAFSAKIQSLVETFPDARILYLVRNPLDMEPSTISWLSYAWGIFSVPKERYPFRKEVLAMTKYWYRHPLKFIDDHPSDQWQVVVYDDLMREPMRVIRTLYRQFDYPIGEGLEKVTSEVEADKDQYKSDHLYSYEDMGYSRQEIIDAFPDIFERFHFDRREPLPRFELHSGNSIAAGVSLK